MNNYNNDINNDNYNNDNYNNDEIQLMNDLSNQTANSYGDKESNFFLALVSGTAVAFICSILMSFITYLTNRQFVIMIFLTAFLVGSSIRLLGKGKGIKFGILGSFLTLFSCVFANLIFIYSYFGKTLGIGFFNSLSILGLSGGFKILIDSLGFKSVLFYLIAVLLVWCFLWKT